MKSEAELRSVQNTLKLLNQSLSPTFSRKLLNMKDSEQFGGSFTAAALQGQEAEDHG